MERDKPKKSESVGQSLLQLPWKQKRGDIKKFGFLSSNFMKLCRNIHRSVWQLLRSWGEKMVAVAMVTKVQKMLNSLQTADPFETWHKNRSSLKVVLFVFKIFKMATNIKIQKSLKIQKWKDFSGNGYLQEVRHAAPYCDHFGLLWWPFWIQNYRQNTKILRFGRNVVSK